MNIDEQSLKQLKDLLSGDKKDIVVVGHANPDGDAIGSSLAWGAVLEANGHKVTYVVPNKFPYFLDWMSGIDKINIFKYDQDGKVAALISQAQVIFCMDFNAIARLEGLGEAIEANTTAKRVLMDHHLSPPNEYDIVFSYTQSSSTAFLVYCIIEQLYGVESITSQIGESIYVGLMTDTGNFSFSNLTPELFRAIATLVERGIDIPKINSSVYNSYSSDRVRLLGYTLGSKMQIFKIEDVSVAYITLSEAEMRKFKFQVGDSEGFVNYPLTIKEVSMSAMFLQTKHFIRVSLRSRGSVDVNVFARKYFAGGGHKNAAGGKSFVSIDETIAHFEASAKEYFSSKE